MHRITTIFYGSWPCNLKSKFVFFSEKKTQRCARIFEIVIVDILRSFSRCISDTANKYDALLKNRKSLEADWMKAAEAKRERDLEQRLHDKAGARLMHEQCDRYKRCRQCKRRMDNVGETNIWRETKYLPGTRIMA